MSDLAVYQGVLYFDGGYCERANVDSMENTLAWSRQTGNGYQHAFCALDDDLVEGQGLIFTLSDPDPSSRPSGADQQWFRLAPPSAGLYRPRSSHVEPETDVLQNGHLSSSLTASAMPDGLHQEPQATRLPSLTELSAADAAFDGSAAVFSEKLSSRATAVSAEYSEIPYSWELRWTFKRRLVRTSTDLILQLGHATLAIR